MKKISALLTIASSLFFTSCGGPLPPGYLNNNAARAYSASTWGDATRERARIANNKVARTTSNPYIRHQSR